MHITQICNILTTVKTHSHINPQKALTAQNKDVGRQCFHGKKRFWTTHKQLFRAVNGRSGHSTAHVLKVTEKMCVGVYSHLRRARGDMWVVINTTTERSYCAADGVGGFFEAVKFCHKWVWKSCCFFKKIDFNETWWHISLKAVSDRKYNFGNKRQDGQIFFVCLFVLTAWYVQTLQLVLLMHHLLFFFFYRIYYSRLMWLQGK